MSFLISMVHLLLEHRITIINSGIIPRLTINITCIFIVLISLAQTLIPVSAFRVMIDKRIYEALLSIIYAIVISCVAFYTDKLIFTGLVSLHILVRVLFTIVDIKHYLETKKEEI